MCYRFVYIGTFQLIVGETLIDDNIIVCIVHVYSLAWHVKH